MTKTVILTAVFTAAACFFLILFEKKKVRSKKEGRNCWNPYFYLGTITLLLGWGIMIAGSFRYEALWGISVQERCIAGGLLLAGSIGLYLYLLVFALPKGTYAPARETTSLQKAGIYGVVRHPGFYGFCAVALSAAALAGSKEALVTGVIYSALNLVYIILQDRLYFPAYLDGYEAYREEVPFLIPGRKKKSS